MPPASAATESYLVLGPFGSEAEARNAADYLRTRFVRFLVSSILLTQNITRGMFAFVPKQDFSVSWSDTQLYQKYELSEVEIALIESQIKAMGSDDV
jgi:site-specific DNA-methyltransferase (adenine-specific)